MSEIAEAVAAINHLADAISRQSEAINSLALSVAAMLDDGSDVSQADCCYMDGTPVAHGAKHT